MIKAPAFRRIAYTRTSPGDSPDALVQLAWVTDMDQTFEDVNVGPRSPTRPQRLAALAAVRAGDTLVVHSMNRLCRDVDELRAMLLNLAGRGVAVEFISEAVTLAPVNMDAAARDVALVMAGAAFVKASNAEKQGMGINKVRGIKKHFPGRPLKLGHDKLRSLIARFRALDDTPEDNVTRIAAYFEVTRATVYRYAKAGDPLIAAALLAKKANTQAYRASKQSLPSESARLYKVAAKTARYGFKQRQAAFRPTSARLTTDEATSGPVVKESGDE